MVNETFSLMSRMWIAVGVVLFCAAATSSAQPAERMYVVTAKTVKMDLAGRDIVLKAKTVAIFAAERRDLEILNVDEKKRTAVVEIHGGIRRGVSAEKAKKALETMVREWGRFALVDDPEQADLVMFLAEDSVPPSGFSQMGGDFRHRLRDRLAVFPGRVAPSEAPTIWADTNSESTFGALTGSSVAKVANKFRRDVEEAIGKWKD